MQGGAVNGDGNAAMVEIPYLEKMRWVCKDLGYEEEYADIVGSRLLDIEGADYNTTTVNGEVPTLDTVVDFLAQAFLRFTLHAGVVLVTADDIHWMVGIVRYLPQPFRFRSICLLIVPAHHIFHNFFVNSIFLGYIVLECTRGTF